MERQRPLVVSLSQYVPCKPCSLHCGPAWSARDWPWPRAVGGRGPSAVPVSRRTILLSESLPTARRASAGAGRCAGRSSSGWHTPRPTPCSHIRDSSFLLRHRGYRGRSGHHQRAARTGLAQRRVAGLRGPLPSDSIMPHPDRGARTDGGLRRARLPRPSRGPRRRAAHGRRGVGRYPLAHAHGSSVAQSGRVPRPWARAPPRALRCASSCPTGRWFP